MEPINEPLKEEEKERVISLYPDSMSVLETQQPFMSETGNFPITNVMPNVNDGAAPYAGLAGLGGGVGFVGGLVVGGLLGSVLNRRDGHDGHGAGFGGNLQEFIANQAALRQIEVQAVRDGLESKIAALQVEKNVDGRIAALTLNVDERFDNIRDLVKSKFCELDERTQANEITILRNRIREMEEKTQTTTLLNAICSGVGCPTACAGVEAKTK